MKPLLANKLFITYALLHIVRGDNPQVKGFHITYFQFHISKTGMTGTEKFLHKTDQKTTQYISITWHFLPA